MIFGQCDCCAKPNRVLHHRWPSGVETWACAECCYGDLIDDISDIEQAIATLKAEPSLSEDGARHLANLETALRDAKGTGDGNHETTSAIS